MRYKSVVKLGQKELEKLDSDIRRKEDSKIRGIEDEIHTV